MNNEREMVLNLLKHELNQWNTCQERAANHIKETLESLIEIIETGSHLVKTPKELRP